MSNTFYRRSSLPTLTSVCLCVMSFVIFVDRLADSSTSDSRRRIDALLRAYERVQLPPIDDEILLTDDSSWKLASRDRAPIHLTVNAFSRSFDVTLRRGQSVYMPDAKIIVHDADAPSIQLPASEFGSDSVEGYVIGDPDSYVHGHVINGVFDGIISVGYENYYIEPAFKFFDDVDPQETSFNDAVVYRESDVNFSPNVRPRRTVMVCMDTHGGDGGRNRSSSVSINETSSSSSSISNKDDSGLDNEPTMTMAISKDMSDDEVDQTGNTSPQKNKKNKKKSGQVCKVKAVVDHTFYRVYARSNLRKAVSHVEFHIREADRMFSVADFDNDGQVDGVRIRLAALEVYKSKKDKGYLLADETMDATVFLQKFTFYDHDGMCAAMAFSHRPFKDDVLGYAYRGGPNHAGGICYPRRKVNGKMRSLNVGLTSTNAPWGTLAVAQSVVVVTHELGHMFGAMHDEDADGGACFHANRQRHYIMSSMANPGKSVINRRFSKCSRTAIEKNILVNGKCLQCEGRACGSGARVIPSVPLGLIVALTVALQMLRSTWWHLPICLHT